MMFSTPNFKTLECNWVLPAILQSISAKNLSTLYHSVFKLGLSGKHYLFERHLHVIFSDLSRSLHFVPSLRSTEVFKGLGFHSIYPEDVSIISRNQRMFTYHFPFVSMNFFFSGWIDFQDDEQNKKKNNCLKKIWLKTK